MISQPIHLDLIQKEVTAVSLESKARSDLHLNYADGLVDFLARLKVDSIFGVPGGAIEPFLSAIARHLSQSGGDGPRLIVARHEAGAAFMAEGYARETGKLGVCCATTGPGATNLITGICSAYTEQIPVLVLTAQTALPGFGRLALQESSGDAIDTVGMFQHCTRYNSLVSHPEQVRHKLYQAVVRAFQHPRGPVHLSLPADLMKMPLPENRAQAFPVPQLRAGKAFDETQLQALLQMLVCSRRAVLLVGEGCRDAIAPILALSDCFDMPVITTSAGKGSIDTRHPRYRGIFGFAGHAGASETLFDPEVDLILAVGTRLDEITTNRWDQRLFNEKMVHVDENPEAFLRSPTARLHVLGNLDALFRRLLFSLRKSGGDHAKGNLLLKEHNEVFLQGRTRKGSDGKRSSKPRTPRIERGDAEAGALNPQGLMRELAQRFPSETRFLADAGNAWAWSIHHLDIKKEGRYHIGMGYGAMAWGIGAAAGVALGAPGKAVVCITGDGSFLMSGQELTVAVSEALPITFVILNDGALGMVKHGQRMSGAEPIGYILPPVDFAAMARAMGAAAHTITSWEAWDRLDFEKICTRRGPTLLDVHIDPEAVPPMGERIKCLQGKA